MGCTITRNDITTEAYPDGMAQPCVLAVRTDDAQNEDSVLYKWCQWQVRSAHGIGAVLQGSEQVAGRLVFSFVLVFFDELVVLAPGVEVGRW